MQNPYSHDDAKSDEMHSPQLYLRAIEDDEDEEDDEEDDEDEDEEDDVDENLDKPTCSSTDSARELMKKQSSAPAIP